MSIIGIIIICLLICPIISIGILVVKKRPELVLFIVGSIIFAGFTIMHMSFSSLLVAAQSAVKFIAVCIAFGLGSLILAILVPEKLNVEDDFNKLKNILFERITNSGTDLQNTSLHKILDYIEAAYTPNMLQEEGILQVLENEIEDEKLTYLICDFLKISQGLAIGQ